MNMFFASPPTVGGPYYYLPQGWNTAWSNAKAARGSRQIAVAGIGDSITQGWMSTDVLVDSWWAKLRASILAANQGQLAGDHWGLMLSQQCVTTFGGPGTAIYPFTFAGTINTNFGIFPGGYNYVAFNDTAQAAVLTFVSPYACTAMDIVYVDGFQAGSWSYSVDGGGAVTVNTTGPGSTTGGQMKKISLTGLSAAKHTIVINAIDANFGSMIIAGVNTYANPTSGILFNNMGWPGMGLITGSETDNNLFSGADAAPIDRVALYQGFTGAVGAPIATKGFGFPSQPDLAIIALGINDASQNVARGTFRDGLDRLVWSLRYGKTNACSIIIMGVWGPDGTLATSTTVTNQDQTANSWTAYRDLRAAMVEVAQNEQCAYIDVHGFFGRFPVTTGLIDNATDVHPTPLGHQQIANLLSTLL